MTYLELMMQIWLVENSITPMELSAMAIIRFLPVVVCNCIFFLWLDMYMQSGLSVCLSVYLHACLLTYLPACLGWLAACMLACLPGCGCLTACLPICLSACLPAYLSAHLRACLPTCTCLPIYIYIYVCLPLVYLLIICLVGHLPVCLSVIRTKSPKGKM